MVSTYVLMHMYFEPIKQINLVLTANIVNYNFTLHFGFLLSHISVQIYLAMKQFTQSSVNLS